LDGLIIQLIKKIIISPFNTIFLIKRIKYLKIYKFPATFNTTAFISEILEVTPGILYI
jgi:hypothetical protein